MKKSLEKSKNVLEEKRKIVKQKICIKKTHTFTIIAMNFIQEQLITYYFLFNLVWWLSCQVTKIKLSSVDFPTRRK